jgi:signal transduction histidine kinase
MDQPEFEQDLLAQIPSPSQRLWVGLWIIFSIFVVFALYAVHEVRWLEDFQVNVVQKNRKASLQLLRLQNDTYALAISLYHLAQIPPLYPIAEWRPEFIRLRKDMDDAAQLESNYAIPMSAAEGKRAQLRTALRDFWSAVDHAFDVAGHGREETARRLLQSEVESKRSVVSEVLARLLVLNDQAQDEAAQRINSVYGSVKTNILIVIALLSLLALGTGLYTLQANRKTFQRLHHLAERLQAQSEQLRKLSWKLIDVQEDTLRRVARDLHDEFGQILTAIGAMLTRAARKTLAGNSEFVQELEAVKRIVEDTLQNVRDRSQMFRPAILDDFGLEQSLQSFVEQFSRQAGINVRFEGKCRDGILPPEDAIHVYRIVQEALNNVARHSGAHEAWVILAEGNTGLKLEIGDNGNGFDQAAEMRRAGGVGLMGMQERAEHLGGCLTVQSAPGRGTVVTFAVPLKRTARVAPIAS